MVTEVFELEVFLKANHWKEDQQDLLDVIPADRDLGKGEGEIMAIKNLTKEFAEKLHHHISELHIERQSP